ncbi:hypothetical protein SCLCIDRAFT_24746 [Scleroderma citrinum Foug A]|uniref:Uncharacterized protein n=1 Tax=Scleroderma citrinum Foug A TaxID=1036808 RepID=A0A0C3E3S1_9AGAM|nr:hypothetical protein SCLCIDRAFT_24746 [Scleroderma citrinum Foug A]
MSDIHGRQPTRSPSPSAHHKRTREPSDEPMSPRDRARRHSDKRRAARSPSPHHHQSPSCEGHHEKHRQVTLHDDSPPPAQWVATTTGLLVHDPRDHCPECLEYQRHVSLDLVLETPSIMAAHEDSLKSLARLLGWSGHMADLEDDLAEMCRDHDHWCRRAEEAETVSVVSKQQEAATFEQARLLSMYIPSACPEDAPGAGPSSQPLEECLISPGGGSGVPPASSHSGEPRSHSSHPQSPGTIFGKMNIDELTAPAPSGSSLAGQLNEVKETMFPLLRQGEVPNQVSILLDGKKYLHLQVGEHLYQFEELAREAVLRNIGARVPPPLAGAIPPGTVCLFNTMDKLDKLYARVAQELDERDSPNTRMGQRLMAGLNRYLGDTDRMMRAKPSKNCVVSHMLMKWRPPAWVMSRSKNKREEYRKTHQAACDGARMQCSTPPPPLSFIPKAQQPPAASVSSSVLEAPQPPAASSVMTTSRRELPPYVPPLYLTRRSCNTNRQDGLPKGAPSWGDELTEWQEFIHRLCCSKTTTKFLGIQVKADPGFIEPPSNQRLRGFVLERYFAPRFQYDSNRNGWHHNFAQLFAVPG